MGRGRRRLSASLLLLAGCTRAPSPTTVTPPPIPLEAFFANLDWAVVNDWVNRYQITA